MQHLVDAFAQAYTALGMTIYLKKTVVMYQSTPGKTHIPPIIYVYGSHIIAVDRFMYLGRTLSPNNTLDNEIALRIYKASESFGRLDNRFWRHRGISIGTKLKVCNACVTFSPIFCSNH